MTRHTHTVNDLTLAKYIDSFIYKIRQFNKSNGEKRDNYERKNALSISVFDGEAVEV